MIVHIFPQGFDEDKFTLSQIQNLEQEIQEKRRQMRVLEQCIIESGEASISNASLVEMQQVVSLSSSFPFFLLSNILLILLLYFLENNSSVISIAFVSQQTVTRLMTQCNEKAFELEVSTHNLKVYEACLVGTVLFLKAHLGLFIHYYFSAVLI